MELTTARRLLEQIEDIEQRVQALEDEGLLDRDAAPPVMGDITHGIRRLRQYAERRLNVAECVALDTGKP